MSEAFTFYRALDPVKGSWDGYGFFPSGQSDFLAFVTDAPSAASVHTPELIQDYWSRYCRESLEDGTALDIAKIELADAINRLHDFLLKRSRIDGTGYQATLSIGRKVGELFLYCSIGDSILQLFRNGKLYRLNESEIWDGSLIVRESQGLKERQKTQLLRFVGDGGDFVPASQISVLTLQPADVLLFSSDGMEDLLTPDALIPLLRTKPDQMRRDLETIFAPEKLRDDITFIAIPVELQLAPDAEKEIRAMRSQIEGLRIEQNAFRNDFTRLAMPAARLERIEKDLNALSQQVQSLVARVGAAPRRHVDAGTGVTIHAVKSRIDKKFWMLFAFAFILGIALATAFFLWVQPQRRAANSAPIRRDSPVTTKSVVPPEISPVEDCVYIVEKGDSLERIAAKKRIAIENLLRWNSSLKKNTPLKIGEKILICAQAL